MLLEVSLWGISCTKLSRNCLDVRNSEFPQIGHKPSVAGRPFVKNRQLVIIAPMFVTQLFH